MDLLIASLLGVIASVLAWLAVTQSLRPRVLVSNFVSRKLDSSGNVSYRIKIMNARHRRNVADVKTHLYVWIPGYWPDRPGSNKIIPVPATSTELVGMEPGHDRVIRLQLEDPLAEVKSFGIDIPPDTNPLEALLALGSGEGQLRMWIGYTDAYSGVRRAHLQRFGANDISDHLFGRSGVEKGRASFDAERPSDPDH